MKKHLQRLFSWSRSAGIEVQLSGGEAVFHFVLLKRKGSKVSIEKAICNIRDLKEVARELKGDIPVSVVITGRSVLHREIQADSSLSKQTMLSKILPGSSLKDLYLQQFPNGDDTFFCFVARKEQIDPLIDQLKENRLVVVKCTLGVFPVSLLRDQIDDQGELFLFGKHRMQFADGRLSELQFSDEENDSSCLLSGEQIDRRSLPAFAAALELFSVQKVNTDGGVDKLEGALEDLRQRVAMKKTGVAFLVFMLFILTCNYFVFSHYWSEKSRLESQLQSDGGAFVDLQSLEMQVNARKNFLDESGLSGNSHQSWMADRIGAGLPKEIVLQELNLFPKIKTSKEDSIGFTTGLIEIAGNCSQSIILNEWIDELKKESWIKGVTVESYLQDKNMNRGEFKITVSCHAER